MIASSKALIAAGLLSIAAVSRVAAADVDDGSRTIVHAHAGAAKLTTTTQFSGWPGEVKHCAGCHEIRQ
jgi:hypothetical protein